MRKLIAAAVHLDSLSKAAVGCLFIAWFLSDTLVARWGSLRHRVRFVQLPAVLADPSMMFFAIPTRAPIVLFSALCLLSLAGPLLPGLYRRSWLAAAHFAPLVLLLTGAALLYRRTAGDMLAAPRATDGLASHVVGLANSLINKGSAAVAHHVTVGLGGYLGLLAALALAVQGVRRLRAAAADAPSITGRDRSAAGAATRRP